MNWGQGNWHIQHHFSFAMYNEWQGVYATFLSNTRRTAMHWMKHRWLLIMPSLLVVLASCSSPAASRPQPTATPTIDSAHLTAFAQPYPTSPPLPTPTP